MRKRHWIKKGLSALLALNMVLSSVPLPAFAAGSDNLCDHHPAHTAECNYVEGSPGSACTHEHSEDCYKIVGCLHTCGEDCEDPCTHECTVENGCITMERDCHHVHGDCGYSEGTAEVPCGHVHDENCGYVEVVYEVLCGCAETDEGGNLIHAEGCGYVAPVEGVACGHVEHTDCGYAPATEGTPCNHVCEVKVNSADSCYKLLCSHKDGGHDNACGYAASVEAHECHYECAECAAALTSEEETDPTTQPTTEPTTAPTTEPAPVCTCESDDPDWHAPFCDLYVVPENPRCYCVEKCGDGAFNEWCEVCYFDPGACWASGEEEAAVYPSTPTYIASIGIAQDASSGSTGVNDCKNELSGHTIIDRDLNDGARGDYVYIGYKTTTDPSKAITGILFRVGENPPDRITDNGKAYFYLVGGSYESNTASEGGYIDLNAKAGGDYIYMYVTRDSSYGAPLTAMTVDESSSKSGYTTGTNTSGSVIDLNQNVGGDYLYLHYKRFSATVNATYYYLDAGGSRTSSTQSATVKNHLETLTKVPSHPTSVTYDGRTFTFKGWREDNTADAATVTAPSVTYITGDKTYRAVYSANVKLSYDANGGSGAPAAQTAIQYINTGFASTVAKQSVRFTIPDSTYTHDSKCFLGWSANQAATTVTYQPGGTISIDSNKTLYAVYADHTYNNGICSHCGEYISDAVAVLSKNGKNVFAGNTLDAVITEAEKCVESDKAVVTFLQDIDLGSNYQRIDSGVFTIDLNGCKLSYDDANYSTLRIYNSGTDITLISSRTGGTVENRRYNGRAIFTDSNTNLTATGISVITGSEGYGIFLNGNANLSDVTVQAGKEGIRVQTYSTPNKPSLTCTNCTVQATDTALYVGSDCTATITGGRLQGDKYDIASYGTTLLALDENGVGTTFSSGINVNGNKRLNNILADGAAYWAGDTMLSVADNAWEITDKGDITVKAACTHESGKQNYVNNGDNHTYTWSCCKLEATEGHTFADMKCVCGARDHDCVYTNGFCEKGCYEPAELIDGYYQIKNGGQMFWFAEYINTVDRAASAKLTADIDLENRAWTRIGSTGETNNNFRGHFDGQGYTIEGLNSNVKNAGGGFFGEVRLGTVENFTIKGTVTVAAGNVTYVGGVIGSAPGANSNKPDHNGATIRNITSYVNVTVQDGLTGVGRIGGFMGYANHETIIENCAWYGTLDLGNQAMTLGAGGFIGRINEDSAVTIRNCGAYGSIVNEAVTENVGAFMGLTNSRSNTVMENCLFAGGVTGANASAVTPFGTWNGASKTLTNSYYINTLGTTDADATAVTPDQLASGEVAYKLGAAWGQNLDSQNYPVLGGKKVYCGYADCKATEVSYANSPLPETMGDSYDANGFCTVCDAYEPATGSGTESDPYKIGNAGQLYWFVAVVNSGYGDVAQNKAAWAELTANIVVNENVLKTDGSLNEGTYRAWTPIGSSSSQYTGTFDGKEFTVSGLYFNKSSTSYVGLFGYVSGGTVQNVGIVDSYFSGNNCVGGVVGYNSSGTVSNCYNTSTVNGTRYVGGVVGYNSSGTVTDSYNTGSVSGTSNDVGGVVGYNAGTVKDCYNTGSVSGTSTDVGGVVGYNSSSGTVSNCYNTSTVNGTGYVGGVVGYNTGTVSNCYNTGSVSGSSKYVGGVVSYNSSSGTVSNCYNTSTVNGTGYVGGVVGYNTGTVTGCYNTGTVSSTNNQVGGVVGDNSSSGIVSNCYYDSSVYSGNAIGNSNGTITNVLGKTTEQFASGEVAYLLQGDQTEQIWGQNIDGEGEKDISPVFSDAKVYPAKNCKDEISGYSNTDGKQLDHTYNDNGFCTVCDGFQSATGSGTESNPYQIGNAGQLYWFAAEVNDGDTDAWAELTADIVVNENVLKADGTLNGDGSNFLPWTPIGTGLDWYTGTFDGNDKTVSGLYVNENTGFVGLFGWSQGTVKNVGVVDSYISGSEYVGGVVGYNYKGTVVNSYSSGSVTGGAYIGGVAAYNEGGTVANCYNTGSVCGSDDVFSINIGGLVGFNSGSVEDCYNTGAVSGGDKVGGLVGDNYGTVESCYNTGTVSGSTFWVGGVMGINFGSVVNCYYDSTVYSGNAIGQDEGTTTDVLGKTTEQFASGEVAYLLQGEQTEQVWGQNIDGEGEKDAYPVFSDAKVYPAKNCDGSDGAYSNTQDVQKDHIYSENGFCIFCEGYQPATGSGTESDPYKIGNAGQLYWFAAEVNDGDTDAWAELTADIVVNQNVLKEDGSLNGDGSNFRVWTPISNNSNRYTGTFDGKEFTVSGLYFNNNEIRYVGLFGYVYGGTVQNVGIVDSYLSGDNNVGGVVGYHYSGTVINCYNAGSISGNNNVGGVAGTNSRSTVTDSYNEGSISGNHNVGGVAGDNYYGTLINSYNEGSISGSSDVGGVAGRSLYSGPVNNCYNVGTVSGDRYVGGVVGYNDSTSTMANCYNSGIVSGSDGVGGVVGYNSGTTSTVENCYYDSDIYGGNAIGSGNGTATDVEGKTTEQFASGEVAYLLQGEQTEQVWGQNIGTDAAPNFTGAKVYQVKNCKGETDYSNTNENGVHDWSNKDGICTVCGTSCDHADQTGETCGICGAELKPAEIISVNISWGDMSFTYDDTVDEVTGKEKGWTDNGTGWVKVANSGNTNVAVTYTYETERTDITGSFSDGTNPVTAPVTILPQEIKQIWLILANKPKEALDKTTIGSVKLIIE